KGVVGTSFTAQHNCRRSLALFREDLNDAGKRPWPIQGALRSAHDFDPLDVVRYQIGEIQRPLQTLINRNAVEQYLRMLAAQSTRKNPSQLRSGPVPPSGYTSNSTHCS